MQWADSGAPRGNPTDMPPPVAFNDDLEWVLEEAPDLIAEMPEWHTVKANGPDEKITFAADFLIEEDRWIRAVETKPDAGSFSVVHHSNTSLYHEEEGWNDFLNEYAVGKGPDIFPEDSGRLLPSGARILFNVHYHSLGEEIRSRSRVAFWLYWMITCTDINFGWMLTYTQVKYDRGLNVQPAFEGWVRNPDGTIDLWFGYLNRNWAQRLHIPIGPDNTLDPGGPDHGQPTFFYARRHRYAFKVTVPEGWNDEYTWTLTVNGRTDTIHAALFLEDELLEHNVLAARGQGFGIAPRNRPPSIAIDTAGSTSSAPPPSTRSRRERPPRRCASASRAPTCSEARRGTAD